MQMSGCYGHEGGGPVPFVLAPLIVQEGGIQLKKRNHVEAIYLNVRSF
jgi:hypothetical protein